MGDPEGGTSGIQRQRWDRREGHPVGHAPNEVIKYCLEDKWSQRIPDEHPVLPWIMEYVDVGAKCRVACSLRTDVTRGRTVRRRASALQNRCCSTENIPQSMSKLTSLWEAWMHMLSGEMLVATGKRARSTRTVQMKPQSERMSPDVAEIIGGALLHTSEDDDDDPGGPSVSVQLGERMVDESCRGG